MLIILIFIGYFLNVLLNRWIYFKLIELDGFYRPNKAAVISIFLPLLGTLILGSILIEENLKKPLINLQEVFNVENFNKWFNKPKENSYANSGIFLRLDKLSDNFFLEYFKSCGIKDSEKFAYAENYFDFKKFVNSVRKNWLEKNK